MGEGLSKNILSAWHWLCRNVQDGGRLFLIGFSRGACTVRSLAGLMSACGLPDLTGLSDVDRWKRGVHCDVGGGYAETGLSNGALQWMIEEAQAQG